MTAAEIDEAAIKPASNNTEEISDRMQTDWLTRDTSPIQNKENSFVSSAIGTALFVLREVEYQFIEIVGYWLCSCHAN